LINPQAINPEPSNGKGFQIVLRLGCSSKNRQKLYIDMALWMVEQTLSGELCRLHQQSDVVFVRDVLCQFQARFL
jgi:hypothetical protein